MSLCAPAPQTLVPGLSLLAAGCPLPLTQPATWELSGICQHRDSCVQLLGKSEEFLLSLTDVSSCGWDPLASPAVRGAALSLWPSESVLAPTKRAGQASSGDIVAWKFSA